RHADGTAGDQGDDALEMGAVAPDLWTQRNDVGARRDRGRVAGADERGAPAGPQHRERTIHHVAADSVEHRIATGHQLGEVVRLIIDHLIGPELAHVFVVGGTRRRDNARADVLRDLDREAGHAPGTALDQYGLAGLELQRVLDRDERGEADES